MKDKFMESAFCSEQSVHIAKTGNSSCHYCTFQVPAEGKGRGKMLVRGKSQPPM